GTSLGDPIELQALGAAVCGGRDAERPLLVGSVKTNIGHLESAAGIAGLIKAILAVRTGEIPPSLHFHTPNPHVAWERLPIEIPTTLRAWPADAKRIAGVSSFGFSGTNAHVIVEAAPPATTPHTSDDASVRVLALSAANDAALRETADRWRARLEADDAPFGALCGTANTGRAALEARLAVVAADARAAADALQAFSSGAADVPVFTGHAQKTRAPRIAFVFPGQGAQSAGMGRALWESSASAFRETIDRCATLIRDELGWSLHDVLWGDATDRLDDTAYAQPALFAVEVALAEQLRAWGITPAAVAGHSLGEFAAAVTAGVLSLEDGLRLVIARGRLMAAVPPGGIMAAIHAGETHVRQAIARVGVPGVDIAAVNGPENVVVTGEEREVVALLETLAADGIESRRLRISNGFHSARVEPVLGELRAAAERVTHASPSHALLVSTLTGEV